VSKKKDDELIKWVIEDTHFSWYLDKTFIEYAVNFRNLGILNSDCDKNPKS
jgi:hypothetical protein